MDKTTLLRQGQDIITRFCLVNDLPLPQVTLAEGSWPYKVCAYYRPQEITLKLTKCSPIGKSGAAWSYPGYVTDKTPYGVLAHELGHHVDVLKSVKVGPYFGDYSLKIFAASGEAAISSYAPNKHEWFAEMFRVFVTNPDLLSKLRPKTFDLLSQDFLPAELRSWLEVLEHAPERTKTACLKKIHASI